MNQLFESYEQFNAAKNNEIQKELNALRGDNCMLLAHRP